MTWAVGPWAALPWAGSPAAAGSGQTIAVPAGALTLTGLAPTVSTPVAIAVPAGALTLTGFAPTVSTGGTIIQVPAGALTLTGFAPTVVAPAVLAMPAGNLTLTGYAPTVITGVTATLNQGAWAWPLKKKKKTPEEKDDLRKAILSVIAESAPALPQAAKRQLAEKVEHEVEVLAEVNLDDVRTAVEELIPEVRNILKKAARKREDEDFLLLM